MDKKHIELYEHAQNRMEALYNWLKDKYNIKTSYRSSYETYFKHSEYANTEIIFKDLKALNNSLTLQTYLCDTKTEYYLSFWYYTGGSEGHHDLKIDIKKDLVDNDDFFFNFVNDYIEDYFKLKPKTTKTKVEHYTQTTIFDFI